MSKLEGKVAIITGAASGIGEASARMFAANGAKVVLADVQDELGAGVAASIGADKCCYKHCDVRDEKQVEDLVGHAVATYGRLDIMYSNAGIVTVPTSIMEQSLEELDNVIAINTRGSAACIKHAAKVMIASGTRGAIICTGSLSSVLGGLGPHTYAVSKHALLGLVRSASGELGKAGIRVNMVSPNAVPTGMSKTFGMTEVEAEAVCKAMSPLQSEAVLRASDVAKAALFLASDDAAFVAGHNLIIDGGLTAVGPPPPGLKK